MLEKSATMNRRGGDELTILKRYRSTEKSPQIGTMRRAATRLLTPHDESSLKRRLKYDFKDAPSTARGEEGFREYMDALG